MQWTQRIKQWTQKSLPIYKPIRKCTSKANAQQFSKTDSASIICSMNVLYYIQYM